MQRGAKLIVRPIHPFLLVPPHSFRRSTPAHSHLSHARKKYPQTTVKFSFYDQNNERTQQDLSTSVIISSNGKDRLTARMYSFLKIAKQTEYEHKQRYLTGFFSATFCITLHVGRVSGWHVASARSYARLVANAIIIVYNQAGVLECRSKLRLMSAIQIEQSSQI